MAAIPAGKQQEKIFRATVSRGSYRNSVRFTPRGGRSTK